MAEQTPLRAAALAQIGGLTVVLLLAIGVAHFAQISLWQIPLLLALLQGGIAALIAFRQSAPRWWLSIHLAFAPLAVVVQSLDIPPGWFLAAFIFLLLVFWRTDKSRVPLYLTNRHTAAAVLRLIPAGTVRFLDLGCGDGGLLRQLAKARPDCHFIGFEHAPLTWLVARLRTLGLDNASVHRGDFWREPLEGYGVIYAFLSPAPMPQLWEKANAEMAPGALLISNSFRVPDVDPIAVISVADRRGTHLYLYRSTRQFDKGGDSAAFPSIPQASDQE